MQVATGSAAARRRAVGFVLATLLAAGAVILPAGAAVAKPTFTPEEKAAAIVRPAVVYIEVQWEGWVRDKVTGKLWDTQSVSVTTGCSGFAISNDGFMVTAGHCVDPGVEGVALAFYQEIADRYYKADVIKQSQIQDAINDMVSNAEVEGKAAGDPAVRKVFAQRGVAKSGLTSGEAIQARVVSFRPVSDGDVALIKVEKSNQPMVTLADSSDIKVGTDVLAIGYPASADNISDATLEPSNKDGKISNKRTEGGVPFYETSAATTQGMSGGPVANLNGEIIGLISHGPAAEKQAFNFLAASSVISEELAKNGVKNQLGKIDKDYRDGLNAYYDGHYTSAIEKFDSVLATVPSHAQAQEYRQQAVGLRETEGDVGSAGLGLLIIGGLVLFVIVVIVVVVIVVVVARGKRRRPVAAYPMGPVAYPPISATPYSATPYSGAPMPASPPYGGAPMAPTPAPPAYEAAAQGSPQPQYGQPQYGQPQYGQPPYGEPHYSAPPAAAASASAPPASAPPLFAPPIPAAPIPAPPVFPPPISAPPVSPPVSPGLLPAAPNAPEPSPTPSSSAPSGSTPPAPVSDIRVPQPPAPATTQIPVPPAAPALLYCANCGNGSPAGTTFCPTCGQQFPA